jgi:hypothetical protein
MTNDEWSATDHEFSVIATCRSREIVARAAALAILSRSQSNDPAPALTPDR